MKAGNAADDAGVLHLAGVAGSGMSGLAQVLRHRGCAVTGSDRDAGPAVASVLRKLRMCGVRVFPQDGSGVSPATRAVVVSSAIEADNADVQAARGGGVEVVHRAHMLARMLNGRRCIAVGGTSGKSTVTGMLGRLLECAGADPLVVNGAVLRDWESAERIGNVRVGNADLCVVEADESDRSLLALRPAMAVITNVSADHFDLAETREIFRRFAERAAESVVLPCTDLRRCGVDDVRPLAWGTRFRYRGTRFELSLPGPHNVCNAVQALTVCERLGFDAERLRDALSGFNGLRRRLERVGDAGGVTVIDDYAHNPAKIEAAWRTVACRFRRIHAVWRPHGYGPLRKLRSEWKTVFGAMCRAQDRLTLLPVYDAGGTADRSLNADALAAELSAAGRHARFLADPARLPARLAAEAAPGDAVLLMGARDPDLPFLARRIAEALGAGRD